MDRIKIFVIGVFVMLALAVWQCGEYYQLQQACIKSCVEGPHGGEVIDPGKYVIKQSYCKMTCE